VFKLNKETSTIDGEILKPFLVENKIVYCSDSRGRTKIKHLKDFDFKIEKEKKVISKVLLVKPKKKNKEAQKVVQKKVEIKVEQVAKEIPAIKKIDVEIEVGNKETQILVPKNVDLKEMKEANALGKISNENYI